MPLGISMVARPFVTQPLFAWLMHVLSRLKKCWNRSHRDKDAKPGRHDDMQAVSSSGAGVDLADKDFRFTDADYKKHKVSHLAYDHFLEKLKQKATKIPARAKKGLPWPKEFKAALDSGNPVENTASTTSKAYTVLHRFNREERAIGVPITDAEVNMPCPVL